MLLLLVDTDCKHRLTVLHLSKLIMRVLTLRDISKFSSVNTASNIRDKKMRILVQTTTFRPLLWCTNTVDQN